MKKLIKISSLSMIASTIAISLILTGCGSDDPDNKGNHLPDVNIVQNNKTVNVGTKVNLTSVAIDVDGDALTYEWKFISKPAGSSATLTSNQTTITKETSFTADKEGKYVVQFSAKDVVDAVGKDTVTIIAKKAGDVSTKCTNYTEISGTYSTDTTLSGCYRVVSSIAVGNNALLTIEKDSTLLFTAGTELTVRRDGALKAVGTVEKPILFTSEQKTPGYWTGLSFILSNNVKNELDYVTIEYGGTKNYHNNLFLDTSRIKISNSTLQYSLNDGFRFTEGSIIDKFSNVTSTKNGKSAGTLHASALGSLDSASKFTGNKKDYIVLKSSRLEEDATWQALSVPVNVDNYINISANLVIKKGSTFAFNSDAQMLVRDDGSLSAKGTQKEPILFTGEQKTAGYWRGLYFDSSNNIKNELDYVTIEYGGRNRYGNLFLGSSSRVNATNSTFSHSSKYGIFLWEGSITKNSDIATSNTFIDNASGTIGTN